MMKNILSAAALAVALGMAGIAALPVQAAGKGRTIQAIYDGDQIKSIKIYPFAKDEYVSVREMARLYGARCDWRPVSGKVALLMNNERMEIYIKSTRVRIGETRKRLPVASRLVKQDLYIPIEFILSRDFADFTDTVSSWNPETDILTIERRVNIVASRFYTKPAATQIVIELLEDLPYSWEQKNGESIVVSFPRGKVKDEHITVDDGVVREIISATRGRLATVTIPLVAGGGDIQKTFLRDPDRLVITISRGQLSATIPSGETVISSGTLSDLSPAAAAITASTDTVVPVVPAIAAPPLPAVVPVAAVKPKKKRGKAAEPQKPAAPASTAKRKKIIIDAGHGGEDPGAIGPNGTMEKDINMKIAYELKRLLAEDEEYEPILTRSDDTFIPLVERTSFANDQKADLFVSVHCNANFSRSVTGFEIYFLSEKASDSDAAATAVLENSVVRLEGNPTKKRARIQELLWSMAVNEFINESSELCSFVTSEVTRRLKIESRGVKQAGFYVLKGTQMPAVLVECAFLSNYGEEAKLKTKRFQAYIADSMYEGIKKYYVRQDMLAKAKHKETLPADAPARN